MVVEIFFKLAFRHAITERNGRMNEIHTLGLFNLVNSMGYQIQIASRRYDKGRSEPVDSRTEVKV